MNIFLEDMAMEFYDIAENLKQDSCMQNDLIWKMN